MLGIVLLAAFNHFQAASFDIDHETMHWNFGKIGTIAYHIDDFFDVDMDIIKDAEPAHQAIDIAQFFLFDQSLWVYA